MSDDEPTFSVEAMRGVLLRMIEISNEELAAYVPKTCAEALAKKIVLDMCSEKEEPEVRINAPGKRWWRRWV